MTRKKVVDPQDDIDTCSKLLCDEASNHMKVRNYHRALNVYNKVNAFFNTSNLNLVSDVWCLCLSFEYY